MRAFITLIQYFLIITLLFIRSIDEGIFYILLLILIVIAMIICHDSFDDENEKGDDKNV